MPPYDDIDVIAGQGTIGMEILRQQTGVLDYIFVPVGGGGILAGIAAYVKYLRPEIKVTRRLHLFCLSSSAVFFSLSRDEVTHFRFFFSFADHCCGS